MFKLKQKEYIGIFLKEGVPFFFSGKLLAHRQTYNMSCIAKEDVFVIFVSYGGEGFIDISEVHSVVKNVLITTESY